MGTSYKHGTTSMFSQFFKKRKISHPRYPTHLYHVSIGETGELIGLPKEWTLEAPHAFRKHPIAKTNPQTQSPEQQNPPPPEPHPPPISRSPPLPQSPLIHPKSILGRIGKSSSAPTSTVKSHHALSQQKEKENNVFSEWIDKAVSNNYLKLHKYGVFSDTKEIGSVVKLLDKVDINDPIQVVDDVPSPDLTTNINDPSSNSTENQIVGSKTYLFEITSTMERRLYEE
ncbi:13038_t:CDS:2 [Entrophospora sp. SA101]|nr:13038_t:CDS:2 [Entrophospora sp. SA101]